MTGTDAGGGVFEWVFHLVSTLDGEDRLSGSELFDEDDFPAALARLDGARRHRTRRPPPPTPRERRDRLDPPTQRVAE